jgi:hypothetical protein
LMYEPIFLRHSCETRRNSVGWRKRLTSIQLGRLAFMETTAHQLVQNSVQ